MPGPGLPPAGWGWPEALAGLGVAFGPELVLYLLSWLAGLSDQTTTKVTVASALALAVISLVVYGWHTFAAWFFSLRRTGVRLVAWGFRRPSKAIFWTVPAALAAVYVVSTLHDLVVHPRQQDLLSEFPHSAAGVTLFLLVAVVMAPVFEEIFFRGFLFRGFAASWGWVWGAVASAAIFSLAHLQLSLFVPLFCLGFALAWVYRRTGSLWGNITLHAVFNLISVLAWYFAG